MEYKVVRSAMPRIVKVDREMDILASIMKRLYGIEFIGVKCRRREISDMKKIFAFVARYRLGKTEESIASYVGWENHASAHYAADSAEDLMRTDERFKHCLISVSNAFDEELVFRNTFGILADM